MNKVWSWDNCFHALAVLEADSELAFDQMRVFYDTQDPCGSFSDMIDNLSKEHCFTKPPVFGWTLRKMIERLGEEAMKPFVEASYDAIVRNTEFWFDYRDADGNGFPAYLHGNDSGWDNASVFDSGFPVEGADLAAFLVVQMETLGKMARMLRRWKAAKSWESRADKLASQLVSERLREGCFVSLKEGHKAAKKVDSLINRIPIILGERLPEGVRRNLVRDCTSLGHFRTEHGLATQSVSSEWYDPSGYWRGPIWAPPTYFVFDGLRRCGEEEHARALAESFCDLCSRDGGIMWENYDALSGEGQHCPGYGWTAAVFLLMARWLEENPRP